MNKAVYHQAAGDKELYVIAENDNATVDLGLKNGVAVVTNCRTTGEVGACTIISPEPKKKSAKKKQTKTKNSK